MAALALRRAGLRCTMLALPRPANHRGAIESVPPMVPRLLEAAGVACDRFVDAIAGRFDGMVSDGKSIWVAEFGQRTLARLDARYGLARRAKLPGIPGKDAQRRSSRQA